VAVGDREGGGDDVVVPRRIGAHELLDDRSPHDPTADRSYFTLPRCGAGALALTSTWPPTRSPRATGGLTSSP
jgi:hypothetical protein